MFFRLPRAKLIFYAIYMTLAAISIYFFLGLKIKVWQRYGQTYCMLDCLHAVEAPWNFGFFFLPITLWKIMQGKSIHTMPHFVVKYVKTETIWRKIFMDFLKESLIYGSIYSIAACVISGLSAYSVNNWGVEGSIFFQETGTTYTGASIAVCFLFFLFNIIKIFLASCMILFVEEWAHSPVIGYLVLGACVAAEWCFSDIALFFNRFCISPENFKSPVKGIGMSLLAFLGALAIFVIGQKQWKNKEFYDEKMG